MTTTNGKLGLKVFGPGQDGWAGDMNKNLECLDGNISDLHEQMITKATDLESQMAARSAEIAAAMVAGNASFAEVAEAVKAEILSQFKTYVDTMIQSVVVTASGNMTAVMSSIESEKARLAVAENLINSSFDAQEQRITNEWADLGSQVGGLGAAASAMAATLTAELNLLASGMASHLESTGNPHRVTFQQVGGAAALRYVADSTKDKRYI